MADNDLSEADFAALAANYPNLYPARWRKAQRIRTHLVLEIEYQLMVSASLSYTDAQAPVEVRRWKRAVVREDHSTLAGVRLHVPKRLQALLSLSHSIHLDCLRWGDEAWLLAFDSPHVPGLRHDLLAEWQALSAMQPLRRLSALEEQVYAPQHGPLEDDNQINWMLLATAVLCGGLLLLSHVEAGVMGLLPLCVGLSILLWQMRLELFPAKRSGWLLRIEQPLQRIDLRIGTPIYWYRCGELLFQQDYDVLEPDAGKGALVYVNTSPGQLQVRLARIGQRLMAWRCRDSFLAWLQASADAWIVLLPLVFLAMISLFQLLSIGSKSFDPWLLAYSLLATGILAICRHRWIKEVKRGLITCFDEASR